MSIQNLKTSQSASWRAKQLKTVINQLKRKIKKIEKEGEVARKRSGGEENMVS